MACPFGFARGADHDHDEGSDTDGSDACKDASPGAGPAGGGHCPMGGGQCPMGGGGGGAGSGGARDDGRFDYDKDPVSWFFQNQIKSEEDFQARKAELRAAARARLDAVFEKKKQRLLVDSDDDDFSIGSSELSAWDSDVASITSMASAAREWREKARFAAPAEAALQVVLVCAAALAAYTCWLSFQAMVTVNRFWGVIHNGWLPMASFVASAALAAAAAACWLCVGRTGKRCLLGFQVGFQVAYAVVAGLALVGYLVPARIDEELRTNACGLGAVAPRGGGSAMAGVAAATSEAGSRLCKYLPAIRDEVVSHVEGVAAGCAWEAAALAGALALSAFYAWELGFVEKRATKHKRRRRHRKGGIPWDKIKIENIGPVTTCGGAGAAAAAQAAKGGAKTRAGPSACPFASMAAAGGGDGRPDAVPAADKKNRHTKACQAHRGLLFG